MDRTKEDVDESLPATTSNVMTTNDIDDTSTDSSGNWTLVFNKKKNKTKSQDDENYIEILNDEKLNDNIKNDEKDEENKEEYKEQELNVAEQETRKHDPTIDDYSDSVSIISESESVGRVSPHNYVRDNFNTIQTSLYEHMDDIILNKIREGMENESQHFIIKQSKEPQAIQQLRQRRKSSTSSDKETKDLQKVSQTIVPSGGLPHLVRRGLQGIFYVGVGLALLALIGKIIHPTWQPLPHMENSNAILAELEQKFIEMELQNNLMRAEIDLLNKQVKYLASLHDFQRRQKQKQGNSKAWTDSGDSYQPVDKNKPYRCPDGATVEMPDMCVDHKPGEHDKGSKSFKAWAVSGDAVKLVDKQEMKKPYKCSGTFAGISDMCADQTVAEHFGDSNTFKAWPGNGDAVKPVDITKEDLKKPYKCSGTFAGIDGMCADQKAGERRLGDQFGKVVDGDGEESDAFKTFQKVTQELHGFPDDFYDQEVLQLLEKVQGTAKDDSKKSKNYEKNEKYEKYSKQGKPNKFNNISKEKKHRANQEDFDDDSLESSKENRYSKENRHSKENRYSKEDRYSKENHSKENHDSKEDHSKERFNKHDRNENSHYHDDNANSGEWQRNYMKHRNQQRKENNQKYQENKNWYIKRADNRNGKRDFSGEKHFS